MTIKDGAITGQKYTKNHSWIPWTVAGILAVTALVFGVVSSNLSAANGELEAKVSDQKEQVTKAQDSLVAAQTELTDVRFQKEQLAIQFEGCADLSESADTYVATLEEAVVVSLTLVESLANLDEAGVMKAAEDLDRIDQTLADEQNAFESALRKCDATGGTTA